MKVFIGRTNETPFPIEIEPNSSLEDVIKLLQEKHGYPEGEYKFIVTGKFLKNPNPFANLNEKTRIIVYIGKGKATKPTTQAPAPAAPVPAPASSQTQEQGSEPATAPQPTRPHPDQNPRMTQEQAREQLNAAIKQLVTYAQYPALMNPDNSVWKNSDLLVQVEKLIRENDANKVPLINHIITHQTNGVNPMILLRRIFAFLNLELRDFCAPLDELEARVEQLSVPQKKIYEELSKEFGKERSLNVLEETNFDADIAREKLRT